MTLSRAAWVVLPSLLIAGCGSGKSPPPPPVPAVAAKDPNPTREAFLEGEAALRVGDAPMALELFRQAVEAEPASFLAWARWHEVARAVGKADAVKQELSRKLAESPEDPLWLTLNALTDPTDREVRLRKAISVNAGFAWAHYALAEALLESGRPDEALRSADRALQIDPQNGLFHLQRGSVLLWADRPADAREETRKARDLMPGDERPFVLEAQALLDENNLEGAIDRLEEAVHLAPAASSPRRVLCDLRVRRGRAQLSEFQRHFGNGHFGAAQTAAEEAARMLDLALKEAPENEGAKRFLPMAEGAAAAAALGLAGKASEAKDTGGLVAGCDAARAWLDRAATRKPRGETADYIADGYLRLGGLRMTAAIARKAAGKPAESRAQDEGALAAFEACLALRPGSTTAADLIKELRKSLGR